MKPRYFYEEDNAHKCTYNYQNPEQIMDLINKYEAGTFTKWKRLRGVGFNRKYKRSAPSLYDVGEYTTANLVRFGDELLKKIKSEEKVHWRFKIYYLPTIGVCVNLKSATMICYRALQTGDSKIRSVFTKSCGCPAVLEINFWGVINVSDMKTVSIVIELKYPGKETHNHPLDEFSVSASDTYPKLKSFIEKCVSNGMGHHNTFIQVRKYARETLVPEIEKQIKKKISVSDTRFYPTRRSVYTY